MKLLMVTQKVDLDDPVLGFAYVWIRELEKQIKEIIVICLHSSEKLSFENVSVFSIKDGGVSRLRALIRFIKYGWFAIFNKKVDGIFVHQCPLYALLIYPLARLKGLPIVLWYAHGHVSIVLRIVSKLVKVILTSTAGGCRVGGKKVKVIGQGIDVSKFIPLSVYDNNNIAGSIIEGVRVNLKEGDIKKLVDIFSNKNRKILLSVGRISPVKDYITLVKAMNYLVKEKRFFNIYFIIVGEPLENKDNEYLKRLKIEISKLGLNDYIILIGAIPYEKINLIYQISDIVISASRTGSLDKVILEAMSSGKIILTSLPIKEVLGDYASMLIYKEGDYIELADKIDYLLNIELKRKEEITNYLRNVVIKNHSVENLIRQVIEQFKEKGRVNKNL